MIPSGQIATSLLLSLGLAQGPVQPSQPDVSPPEAEGGDTPQEGPTAAPEGGAEAEGAAPEEVEAEPEPTAEVTSEPEDEVTAEPEPEAEVTPEPEPQPEVMPQPELTPEPADDEAWEDDEDWGDDEDWDDDYDPLRDSPQARQSQRRIAGGAVLVGLGALASLGALAMGTSDPCARPAGNSCSTEARNRAALTMGLPGVAVLATGVVMLTLGIRQRKTLRVEPTLSRRGGGVVFSGRF